MPDTNVPSAAERLAEYLGFLPDGLVLDDWSLRVLTGIFEPIAKVDRYLALRRERLVDLIDPATVDSELVPHLAHDVGLGSDLSAVSALSNASLQKLTGSAVAIWKTKGTQPSVRTVVAAMLGSRAVILSWFDLRWTTGRSRAVTILPAPGYTGAPYTNPDHVSDVWYMDPIGTVAVTELLRFLDVVRLQGERLNVRRALLLDDLLQGEGFWTRTGTGGSHVYQELAAGGHELQVESSDGFYADLGGDSEAWSEYRATFWLRQGGTGGAEVFVFVVDEGDLDNCYRVDLDVDANELRAYRVHGGSVSLLATVAVTLQTAYAYALGIEVADGTSATTLHVYLEGVLQASVSDSNANRKRAGGVAWGGDGSGAEVGLQHALIFPPGVTNNRVGPNP